MDLAARIECRLFNRDYGFTAKVAADSTHERENSAALFSSGIVLCSVSVDGSTGSPKD